MTGGPQYGQVSSERRESEMRVLRPKKKWLAATLGVVVIGTLAGVALASVGSGFTPTTLVTANFNGTVHLNSDRVKFQTKDPTVFRTQTITVAAGAFSGWHHHPGVILVSVKQGAVTVWQADCTSETYGPGLPNGAAFVEGGDDPIQVTSVDGATEYATQVTSADDTPIFRVEDDPPPCAG
jgi:hypothetical protein